MTSLMETLEVEGVRNDMIRFALKSEMFYAFSVAYYISLLNKLMSIGIKDELLDFTKTIQINISMKSEFISEWTLKKLIFNH